MWSAIFCNRIRPTSFQEHQTDADLVVQAKLGSEQAFAELWGRHGDRVRNIIWRIVRNREDAEDILQEAHLKSFVHLASFNGVAQFSTWLTRIAINQALMVLRKRRNHPEMLIDALESESSALVATYSDYSESIEVRFAHAERLEQLRAAVRQLPPRLRYLVELQNRDELPLEVIAHRMGISVAAVKSRLVRARAALRKLTAESPVRKSPRRLRRRRREQNQRYLPAR